MPPIYCSEDTTDLDGAFVQPIIGPIPSQSNEATLEIDLRGLADLVDAGLVFLSGQIYAQTFYSNQGAQNAYENGEIGPPTVYVAISTATLDRYRNAVGQPDPLSAANNTDTPFFGEASFPSTAIPPETRYLRIRGTILDGSTNQDITFRSNWATYTLSFNQPTPTVYEPYEHIGPYHDSIKETWRWVTKIMTNYIGDEQRVRLAPTAQKTVEVVQTIDLTEAQRLRQYLAEKLPNRSVIPYPMYGTMLKQPAAALGTRVYFTRDNCQISEGDTVLIRSFNEDAGPGVGAVISQLLSDGAELQDPLAIAFPKGSLICPVREIFAENPKFKINTVAGTATVAGEEVLRGRPLLRSSVLPSVITVDNTPVLTNTVLAGADHTFLMDLEDYSTDFGARERTTAWPKARVGRSLSLRVNTGGDQTQFDLMMAFLEEIAGSHKSFLLPRRHERLFFNGAQTSSLSTLISLSGRRYFDLFKNDDTTQHLEFVRTNGTRSYHKVTNSRLNSNIDLLSVSPGIETSVPTSNFSAIHICDRVRMANDTVSVDHLNNRSIISFSVIGVNA
jgi:hypothetical protein